MDSSGRGEGWESSDAMKMLHSCIYYYMKNNDMDVSAEIFTKAANLLQLHPAGDETFLTDWWSIFWDKYSALMGQTSWPSSSLVQPGNVMGNAQKSVHGMAPVEIDQPVLFGADMDTMKMLDSIIYGYMKKNIPQAAETFAIEANVLNMPPDGAEIFLTEWWPIFWNEYCAKFGQNSGPVGESSSPIVQPDNVMGNAQLSIHGKAPVVSDKQVPLGADMDTMMMTWQQPAAHLLAADNYQGRQPAEAPAQVQGQGQRLAQGESHPQRVARAVRAFIQAKADRQAQSQAKAILESQAGASSTNVSSQHVQSSMVGESSSPIVQPDNVMGNAQLSIHGKAPVVSDHQVPLGADMDTMMMTWQQPAAHLLAADNYQGRQPAEAPAQVQGQGQRLAQGESHAQRVARAVRAFLQAKADRQAKSQAKAILESQAGASSTNVSSQHVRSSMVGEQSQHQVPPRGNRDGASQGRSITPGNRESMGTNQQEADVSKELGSR